MHDFVVAGRGVDLQHRLKNPRVQNHKVEPRQRGAFSREPTDTLIIGHIEVPDFDFSAGRLARELDAGIFAFLFVADGEDEMAEAEFEELTRSFEADSDVGAGDDAGFSAQIVRLRAGFGRGEEELAVEEFECLAHRDSEGVNEGG